MHTLALSAMLAQSLAVWLLGVVGMEGSPHKFHPQLGGGTTSSRPAHIALQAVWLLGMAGVEVAAPKEFDDPNITCTNILNGCKKLGFAPPSYHPSKLTVG